MKLGAKKSSSYTHLNAPLDNYVLKYVKPKDLVRNLPYSYNKSAEINSPDYSVKPQ